MCILFLSEEKSDYCWSLMPTKNKIILSQMEFCSVFSASYWKGQINNNLHVCIFFLKHDVIINKNSTLLRYIDALIEIKRLNDVQKYSILFI